jgi:hypothetical protein
VVRAFADDRVEAAHRLYHRSQVVIVDKLGISENTGRLTEKLLNPLDLLIDLGRELIAGIQKTQAVVIGLRQEFDTAGSRKGIESAENFGRVRLKLFEQNARNAVSHLEPAVVFANQVQDKPVGRQVALVGDLSANLGVLAVIKIIDVVVKDGVMP